MTSTAIHTTPTLASPTIQAPAMPAAAVPIALKLAEQLASTPSGLSFHLKELAHSGLIDSEQRGRNLIYRANFARMNGVLAYLTEHCCQGAACEVSITANACTTC